MINGLNLMNGSSPLMEQMNYFHDWVMVFMVSVTISVVMGLSRIYLGAYYNRSLIESQSVEFLWTTFPCLLLLTIGVPSLRLLYMVDEVGNPVLTVKCIGHQWYWSYEYCDFELTDTPMGPEFDSYMINSTPHLLDCDLLLSPGLNPSGVLITAADMLHSWAMPTMGIKAYATPKLLTLGQMGQSLMDLTTDLISALILLFGGLWCHDLITFIHWLFTRCSLPQCCDAITGACECNCQYNPDTCECGCSCNEEPDSSDNEDTLESDDDFPMAYGLPLLPN